jgi:ATP-binding cassette subfamily F protein 3
MIARPANCMLLDEPTNHLDMSSQDVLQEAMAQYDGTIVVVSHNRYFLEGFVNKVLEVKDGNITLYEGNVAEYQAKQELLREQEKERTAEEKQAEDDSTRKSPESQESRKEKKRLEAQQRQERSRRAGPWLKQLSEAEKKVEFHERQKEDLEALMADPELYSDEKSWQKTSKEYEECKRRLERWYDKWETAQEKIDAIDAELNPG